MRSDIVLLIALLGCIVLWLEMLRSRERALTAARGLCQRHGVQLLDETVGLNGMRIRRRDGRLEVQRRYGFEVSQDGSDRHRGHLWMAGGRIISASTPWPTATDSTVIDLQALRRLSRLPVQPHSGTDTPPRTPGAT